MKMGAGDRSYLVRDGEIDVLRNVYGGVEVGAAAFRIAGPRFLGFRGPQTLVCVHHAR